MALKTVGAAAALLLLLLFSLTGTQGQDPKMVVCKNSSYPSCNNIRLHCPPECPQSCYMDCAQCKPICQCLLAGGICQDPRFVGGDGLTFYFHGKKDHDFCIVSDPDLHINAHFIGRRNLGSTRDLTWIQAIAVLFGNHSLYVGALKTTIWNDAIDRLSISFDSEPVILPEEDGATWTSAEADVSVTRMGTANQVVVEAEDRLRITATVVPVSAEESRVHKYGIPANDCFAHLELAFRFYSLSDDVHGVLGQTYRYDYVSPFRVSEKMPVMRGDDKFASTGLFSTDCAVTRYGRSGGGITMVTGDRRRVGGAA